MPETHEGVRTTPVVGSLLYAMATNHALLRLFLVIRCFFFFPVPLSRRLAFRNLLGIIPFLVSLLLCFPVNELVPGIFDAVIFTFLLIFMFQKLFTYDREVNI